MKPLLTAPLLLKRAITNGLRYGIEGEEFTAVPVHPYILLFNLNLDIQCWMHVNNIEVYKYDKTVADKLVLPPAHRDLIDILVTDMDVFLDDIVKGKSGGTPVLCFGPPGLGKTLTAEVYSEIAERPLYKVHSGQLGTTAESVEENLTKILKRSERWGAILLLDEADVYVAKRGNDLERNAVVAAFLRTLEYFNGLMFLTTNRIDDIDDAIVSRMVAMFRYDYPDAEMARKLWTVIGAQFNMVRLQRHNRNGQRPLILHLGDHDPSGKDMTRDIDDRMSMFMGGVRVDRLALNWEQIEQYRPPENPAKITDSRAEKYIQEFGNASWELDALDPLVIRDLIQGAIDNNRDPDKWEEREIEEKEHRTNLLKAAKHWNSMTQEYLADKD
jgi:hypothetical protein